MSSLTPGTRLGPYEVTAQIGVGGMGEVYRAIDTNLKRQVAIKVLPTSVAADADRLARFQREAEVLAALNHPNIAHIFGLEKSDGTIALVMELVEGPTLADRIAQGAIPIAEALPIAKQIAEALEAAHEQGIIHRDLKPANIKVRDDSGVKVLDFGLAKAMDPVGASSANAMNSPTLSIHATQAGIIMGTVAYMSPEQARGKPVDRRTDIWAFGCVLFEMLTGRTLFDGETASDTIAGILDREPDWAALPKVPQGVARLLRRCLSKDAASRLHDIADARIEIVDALAGRPFEIDGRRRVDSRQWMWSALLVIATAASAGITSRLMRKPAVVPPLLVEFPIDLPRGVEPAFGVSVSPDGRRIAMGAYGTGFQIWVRSLDSSETRAIAGTDGAFWPFWSPDGSTLGFFADDKLKKIDLAHGHVTVLCDAPEPTGGSWSENGIIVFSSASHLVTISAAGGVPEPVAMARTDRDTVGEFFPQFLPDNRHFLYYRQMVQGGTIEVASLDRTERSQRVAHSEFAGAYAPPGYLLFISGASLMAQRFDASSFTLAGEPMLIEASAAPGWLEGRPSFSASRTGTVAYTSTRLGNVGELTWVDRQGRPLGTIAQTRGEEFLNPAISPSGEQVAVNRMDPATGNWDVWVIDLARQVPLRLTTDAAMDADPLWSPDGRHVVFESRRAGRLALYRMLADGSEAERLANIDCRNCAAIPRSWSPDGQLLLYDLLVNPPSGGTRQERGSTRWMTRESPRAQGCSQSPQR